MFSIVYISLLLSIPAPPSLASASPGHAITVRELTQQNDERAGRDCAKGGSVKFFENATDMNR